MTYKAKSLIYLGVFASLALTYQLTGYAEKQVEDYVQAQEYKKITDMNEQKAANLKLEDSEE